MTLQTEMIPATGASLPRPEQSLFIKAVAKNRILIFLVLSYFATAHIISTITLVPFETVQPKYLLLMVVGVTPIFVVTMVVCRFGYMVLNVRPEKPILWLVKDMRDHLVHDRERVIAGALASFGVIVFAATFTYVKSSIPHLNPYSWDPAFAQLDRMLHGGYDPYVLLLPVFDTPLMTKLADLSYSFWFVLIYFFAFSASMDKEYPTRRNTFLLSFFLTWIIGGSILATLLSSVGPVYYEAFGYGDQFAPLMTTLEGINQTTPLTALELQSILLDGYHNGGELNGISAMPSMHVALSWVLAFQAFQYRRGFGWTMVGFALLIQLSSVHLGWHYAVDGYLGMGVAGACWCLGKWLAKLQNQFDAASAH